MTVEERPILDPVLKWAGGKRWLVSQMRELYPRKRRLVDPFCGGLALPLALRPDKALLSDANPHLMNLYRWIKHGLEWDEKCGIEFKNDSFVYYDNRQKFNALCDAKNYWTKEGALLFYYLNRTCFNGLCRFNSSGQFNTPFGRYKSISYQRDFYAYQEAFSDWELYIGDFSTLPVEADDFIYADPPYDVEFTQFTQRDFTWEDQERLAKWLAKHPGPVVASNSSTPRVVDLYRNLGFTIHELEAPRFISCNGDRTPAIEILACKGL